MIAGGGACGAVCRYLMAMGVQRLGGATFPVGTLAVNLLGCLVIGFLGALFAGPVVIREEWRFALFVGFLGSFTTFSTYAWETLGLLNDGERGPALANVLLSNVGGLALVWFGYRLAQRLYGG